MCLFSVTVTQRDMLLCLSCVCSHHLYLELCDRRLIVMQNLGMGYPLSLSSLYVEWLMWVMWGCAEDILLAATSEWLGPERVCRVYLGHRLGPRGLGWCRRICWLGRCETHSQQLLLLCPEHRRLSPHQGCGWTGSWRSQELARSRKVLEYSRDSETAVLFLPPLFNWCQFGHL